MVIRCIQAEDLIPISTLAYETLSERYDPVIFTTFFESFPQGFLIATTNKNIIGFIVAIPTDVSTIKVVLFSVKPNYRKQGVGSMLLNSLIEKMKKIDFFFFDLEVKTSNTSAICFYERHGFKKIKHIENFYQNNESAFIMRKSLKL
jgi:ribosomal-protein-alanine acetyltransferase